MKQLLLSYWIPHHGYPASILSLLTAWKLSELCLPTALICPEADDSMPFVNEGHLAPLVLMVCEVITGDPTTEIAKTGLWENCSPESMHKCWEVKFFFLWKHQQCGHKVILEVKVYLGEGIIIHKNRQRQWSHKYLKMDSFLILKVTFRSSPFSWRTLNPASTSVFSGVSGSASEYASQFWPFLERRHL